MNTTYRIASLLLISLLAHSCFVDGELTDFGLTIFCIFGCSIIIILLLFSFSTNKDIQAKKEVERLKSEYNFDEAFSSNHWFYFGLSKSNHFLYIDKRNKFNILFSYYDIISADVYTDGQITYSTKHISGKGAIVGGLVGGGLGAVIGGASLGNRESETTPKDIHVHFLLRNQPVPKFDIECGTNSIALEVMDIITRARDTLEQSKTEQNIIADREEQKNKLELQDIVLMHKQGLLSNDEFINMKSHLASQQINYDIEPERALTQLYTYKYNEGDIVVIKGTNLDFIVTERNYNSGIPFYYCEMLNRNIPEDELEKYNE